MITRSLLALSFCALFCAHSFAQVAKIGRGSIGQHRAAILHDHSLWLWGVNHQGQIGVGNTINATTPLPVGAGSEWGEVAIGATHTLAVTRQGELFAWGSNSSGELGLGTTLPETVPVRVGSTSVWTHIAAGSNFSIAAQADGSLWAFGRNSEGQLGRGGVGASVRSPLRIAGLNSARKIVCGHHFALALDPFGNVWSWGENDQGQLGDGTFYNRAYPAIVTGLYGISDIACGGAHAVAMRSDGTVFTWGSNTKGQLGTQSSVSGTLPSPVALSTAANFVGCGEEATFVVLRDSTAWAFGGNQFGALGIGSIQPTQLDSPFEMPELTATTSLSGTALGGIARRIDGTVWVWGHNLNGRLGLGDPRDRVRAEPVTSLIDGPLNYLIGNVPAAIGRPFTLRLFTDQPNAGVLALVDSSLRSSAASPLQSQLGLTSNLFAIADPSGSLGSLAYPYTDTTGAWQWTWPVPSEPALLGVAYFVECWVQDPGIPGGTRRSNLLPIWFR